MNKLFSKIASLTLGLGLAVGVGVAIGRNGVQKAKAADQTSTLTFSAACDGSGTADDGAEWTVTSDAAESNFDDSKGIHYGTSKKAVSYLKLTTSDIPGKITQIIVNASGASSTKAVLNVTVDGEAFGEEKSITSSAANYTFSGLSSGEIVVNITQNSAANALYCKSVAVTYNPKTTFNIVYDGNGNDSGEVPTDSTEYNKDDSATILGNTGSLKKDALVFSCWNTKADGSGTDYAPGSSLTIEKDATLYAKWVADTVDHIGVTGAFTKTTYLEGQNWDPTGLIVNAYYTDNASKAIDVTASEDLTWSFSPAKANEATITSVIATAHFGGKEASSEAQTVTVNEDNTVLYSTLDELDREKTGVTSGSTTYSNWSGKTSASSAVYAGNSAGSNDSIQLRTTNSNSGIVTTASGGKARKIIIEWESHTQAGRTLNVYGKETAYDSASDLYNNNKSGTLLGSIAYDTDTELLISGDYAFVGLRSSDNAMYLKKVTIVWEKEAEADDINIINTFISENMHLDYTKNEGLCAGWYSTAKAAFNAITNDVAKSILLTSTSKYAKVTLNPEHKADGDPESITYTYDEVKDRLFAWARANGDEYVDGLFTTTSSPIGATINSQPGYVILIAMTTIGIASFGVTMLLKRRKEDK